MTESSINPPRCFFELILLVILLGCGGNEPPPKHPAPNTSESADENAARNLLMRTAIDRRFSPKLQALVEHPDSGIRTFLGNVLGRIPSPRVEPLLTALMDDRDTEVRRAAADSAGLRPWTGVEGEQVTDVFIDAVSKRIDRETDNETRARLLGALGNLAGPEKTAQVIAAIASDRPGVSAAALFALGRMFERGIPIVEEGVENACGRLPSADETIRLAATHVLRFADDTQIDDTCAARIARQIAADASGEVRIQSIGAVRDIDIAQAMSAKVLLAQTDYRVVLAALDRLEAGPMEITCANIEDLVVALPSAMADNRTSATGRFNVVSGVFAAYLRCPLSAKGREASGAVAASLASGAVAASLDGTDIESAIGYRARCLAYAVAGRDDIEVMGCDPTSSETGKRIYIERLANRFSRDPGTVDTLGALMKDGDTRVATTALRALATLDAPATADIVIGLLEDTRIPMVTEALSTIAARPALFAPHETRAISAIASLLDRGERFTQLVLPMMLASTALGAFSDDQASSLIARLSRSKNQAIRESAIQVLRGDGRTLEETMTPLAPPATDARVRRIARQFGKKMELIVETAQGNLVIALDSAAAPVAVDALLSLVRNGYYDNQQVETVEPGFALYLGLPHGMGNAAVDTVFLEPSHGAVERGTVAFRHTDPAKTKGHLFIALQRMPELDGQITVVGRLISGDDVLDRLAPGTPLGELRLSGIK